MFFLRPSAAYEEYIACTAILLCQYTVLVFINRLLPHE